MSEWHGWCRSGTEMALHIGPLPGRKSIAFFEIGKGRLDVFAYFTSKDKAREALKLLEELIDGGR